MSQCAGRIAYDRGAAPAGSTADMPSRFRVALFVAGVLWAAALHVAAQRDGAAVAPPLDGLTPALTAAFNAGARTFTKRYEIADGLGPSSTTNRARTAIARRPSAARALAS